MSSIDWGLLAGDIAHEKDLKSKLHNTFKCRTNKMLNEFQLVKTYGRFSVLSSLSLFANKCAFVLRLFFTQWLQMSIILTISPWWTYSPIKSHQIMCQVWKGLLQRGRVQSVLHALALQSKKQWACTAGRKNQIRHWENLSKSNAKKHRRGCLGRSYSPCLVAFKNILDKDLSEAISVSSSLPFNSLWFSFELNQSFKF